MPFLQPARSEDEREIRYDDCDAATPTGTHVDAHPTDFVLLSS
jgi:hypothetical protein